MNKEEIIALSKECGGISTVELVDRYWQDNGGVTFTKDQLLAFAKAIQDKQREEDAKICERIAKLSAFSADKSVQEYCADAIRSNKE